jgi:hypothetical protein
MRWWIIKKTIVYIILKILATDAIEELLYCRTTDKMVQKLTAKAINDQSVGPGFFFYKSPVYTLVKSTAGQEISFELQPDILWHLQSPGCP